MMVWTPIALLANMLFALGALVILARFHLLITLPVFIPLFGVVSMTCLARSLRERYRRGIREATGALTGFVGELFGAMQAVKVAGAEEAVLAHFRH